MSETSDYSFGIADASFLAAGGEPGIARLVTDFYRIMDEHEGAACVRRLYPHDLSESRLRLAAFLCSWLGARAVMQSSTAASTFRSFIPDGQWAKASATLGSTAWHSPFPDRTIPTTLPATC